MLGDVGTERTLVQNKDLRLTMGRINISKQNPVLQNGLIKLDTFAEGPAAEASSAVS